MIFLLPLLTAAATALGAATAQVPDRSTVPRPGPAPSLKLPPIQKHALSNGLRVWVVELHKVPVVHVSLVVRAGSGADPAGKFGVANLTTEMLDEGAGSRGALDIADAIDYLGASLSTSSSFDASAVDLHVPVTRLAEALPVMADVGLRPTFPEQELRRVREEILTSIVQAQDDPETLVGFAFPRLVYGERHRYGTLGVGTPASLKAMSAADLRQFHAQTFVPGNAVLIVVGDITPTAVLPPLEAAFGSWKGTAADAVKLENAGQRKSRQVFFVDKPGAAQSQIRIGWVGVPRSTKDYFALRVLNTVLGGAFTSRLNTNLREKHGYSYGAASTFDMRAAAGPFYAAAGVQTDKTSEALREFFNELNAIRTAIPEQELQKAKNYIALALPRSFETTASIAAALAQLVVYDLPDDFFEKFTERVQAVTAAGVQRAAEQYIQPDKFAVVIVGDRKVIEPGVRALNLGPVTVVPITDIMR